MTIFKNFHTLKQSQLQLYCSTDCDKLNISDKTAPLKAASQNLP